MAVWDGEASVRPLAVATCGMDRLTVTRTVPVNQPFAFGQEGAAEGIAIDDRVATVRPREVGSIPFQVSCGTCVACLRGHTGNCRSVEFMASYGLPMGTMLRQIPQQRRARVPFADAMLVPGARGHRTGVGRKSVGQHR